MGISTYQSYCGAQIFDAVGLAERLRRAILHRHRDDDRGRRPRRDRRGGAVAPRARLWRQPDLSRDARSSAATTPSACAARTHAWTPQSVAKLQHAVRGNSPADYQAFAATINDQSERLLTIRGLMQFKLADAAGAARRGRAGRRDRQALRDRRDELRLDQPRGAHHAGDRDEPHRRQVEHRRGRRGGRALQAAAERRFDALGDQAGRLGPVRRHHRIPGQRRRSCRSRWRRAPSPAKAASCPATRSTRRSPRCAIRPRASA